WTRGRTGSMEADRKERCVDRAATLRSRFHAVVASPGAGSLFGNPVEPGDDQGVDLARCRFDHGLPHSPNDFMVCAAMSVGRLRAGSGQAVVVSPRIWRAGASAER